MSSVAHSNRLETSFHMSPSLETVIVAETSLSHVDGEKGELVLRGHRLDDLAGRKTIEEVTQILWAGFLARPSRDLKGSLGEAREMAFEAMLPLMPIAHRLDVIDWMRVCLDALPLEDKIDVAIQITGALPVFLAAGFRAHRGEEPVAPDRTASTANDILRMLHNEPPSREAEEALDRYLVTISDHGLNASTFAARVIASTKSDMRSAVSGAIGALKGPLHGGAPGPVLDMIEAIGTPEKADAWIAQELAKGNRLMGFGHRIYRVRDPRADTLKAGLEQLRTTSDKIAHATEIEAAALKALKHHKPDRSLQTNVEFYTAVLLDAIGIDRSLFTPLFAVGRCVGWTAHVMEHQSANKLIRPQALYMGPAVS